MIRTLIALPYEIARLPLVVVDNNLSRRLPDDAPARVALDRAIGTADTFAGSLLRDQGIAARGAERLDRSDTLATAARLEEEAAVRREQARETAVAGRREADAADQRAAQLRAQTDK